MQMVLYFLLYSTISYSIVRYYLMYEYVQMGFCLSFGIRPTFIDVIKLPLKYCDNVMLGTFWRRTHRLNNWGAIFVLLYEYCHHHIISSQLSQTHKPNPTSTSTKKTFFSAFASFSNTCGLIDHILCTILYLLWCTKK